MRVQRLDQVGQSPLIEQSARDDLVAMEPGEGEQECLVEIARPPGPRLELEADIDEPGRAQQPRQATADPHVDIAPIGGPLR